MKNLKGTNTDVSDIIHGFNTSFKNSVGDGIWVDTDARDQQVIELTTKVNHLSSKGTKAVGFTTDPSAPNKDCHACPDWRIKKKGNKLKYPDTGAPMARCSHHKSKNGVVNGMYMPKGHNQDDWVENHTKGPEDWNTKKKEGKGAVAISPVNTLNKCKAVSKLALSKSSKSALVMKSQL